MEVPKDRRYSKEHEWALTEADGTVRIGISEFAEHELGDVVYIELPKAGAHVQQFKQMGEIESVKAVSELYSPVGGEVLEVNAEAVKSPELVNTDPYGKGWLVRVKLSNPADLDTLMDAAKYEEMIS
jgi:glycine cleavage system H protein